MTSPVDYSPYADVTYPTPAVDCLPNRVRALFQMYGYANDYYADVLHRIEKEVKGVKKLLKNHTIRAISSIAWGIEESIYQLLRENLKEVEQ